MAGVTIFGHGVFAEIPWNRFGAVGSPAHNNSTSAMNASPYPMTERR